MKVIKTIAGMRRHIKSLKSHSRFLKAKGKTVGLVPTMGYLHEGHLSLMRAAGRDCDISVLSIFVNPAQFGPKEDYKRYPRDNARDLKLARSAGVDCVFLPEAGEMYPADYITYVNAEKLSSVLCGASRPGHFKGVATVVTKLFNIVQPDVSYFGQKDAQQARIIEKIAEDLNIPVRINVMPIAREPDGVAMSSRNVYLNKSERKDAAILYGALLLAKCLISRGERDAAEIIGAMKNMIKKIPSAKIDYIEIVDSKNLEPSRRLKNEVLVALAVWIGKTRLIDNIVVNI